MSELKQAPASRIEQTVDGFRRVLQIEPGYNDLGGSCGVHGMDFRFVLVGPAGAVQFCMSTGWVPGIKGVNARLAGYYPSGTDLGFHWPTNPYGGSDEWTKQDACEWIEGGCHYDGSGLNADPVLKRFIEEGADAVWDELRRYYEDIRTSAVIDAEVVDEVRALPAGGPQ